MHLTKKQELNTATWAGGTTTQLAIFPETATYKEFNFGFRISYATVEVDESTFTFMPGVTRHLMILKGTLEIDHTDRYKKQLNKFDTDVFNGEWPTTAKGKVTDFNLMTRGAASGKLESLILEKDKNQKLSINENEYIGIYLFRGSLNINHTAENILLEEGDFILFTPGSAKTLLINACDASEIIISRVNLGL